MFVGHYAAALAAKAIAGSAFAFARLTLGIYLVTTLVAFLADLGRPRTQP